MNKKLLLPVIFTLFIQFSYSQNNSDKEKSIAIIENALYHEFYLINKCYYKTTIKYSDVENRIEIDNITYFGDDKNTKRKTSFYLEDLEDLDLNTMKYDLYESEPGLYFVVIHVNAKEKSIEINSVEINKDKFPVPVSETNYVDVFKISPIGKSLPISHVERFIENVRILLGAEKYEKATLFKV